MELTLSILVGVGLSAACGYRIFVPFLILSIAAMTGHVTLAGGFAWIGTWYALTAFAVATILEILAYYIPWVDNLLDVVATPAAVVAGIVITASVVGDVSPFLRWSVAVIAGGGVAGAVQAATVAVRGMSSAATGGLGNPVVATGELGGSVVTSILAVVVPVVAVLLIVALLVVIFRFVRRRMCRGAAASLVLALAFTLAAPSAQALALESFVVEPSPASGGVWTVQDPPNVGSDSSMAHARGMLLRCRRATQE